MWKRRVNLTPVTGVMVTARDPFIHSETHMDCAQHILGALGEALEIPPTVHLPCLHIAYCLLRCEPSVSFKAWGQHQRPLSISDDMRKLLWILLEIIMSSFFFKVQRLPHLGIHPINNHQTQTLWQMPTRACWQEPDITVSLGPLPVPGKYRSGCSQSSIGWSTQSPMKELEKGLKELKGFASL